MISEIVHPAILLKDDEPIEKALQLMNEKKINGAPVVDGQHNLVGMVVKADIYRFLMDPGHYNSCPLNWVMSKEIITANPNEDIITVANRLRSNNIIALPVVEGSKVLGVISIENIMDYFIARLAD
ncbi:CBS domain-containing protein [Desulfotomaculum sp. 1211_IL3151]|uniref:CBS domain-containing protein n=1 Tax=Desulfotomaculum sp. 1211_IL3151 TaxID=3084055 RepID=UPI002FDA8109